jgi:hypothetical protein
MLSDALVAEVKALIASRLGLDEKSIDIGLSISMDLGMGRHTESMSEFSSPLPVVSKGRKHGR